ncbi:MAG: hypothetical protein KDK70_04265 [Myxococcales bacterium]|nr:hypothetical protein [Myxococcales bacterium]
MPDGALATPEAARGSARVEPKAPPRPFSRERYIDPSFSLARHLTRTLGVAMVIAALGVGLSWGAAWWAWLAIPGFWLVSNLFEHTIHRYPMHRPLWPRVLYLNHAKAHHRAFDGPHQQIHRVQELSVVMMPWYTLIIVFLMASPVALAAALLGGVELAGVFLVGAVSYFLFYELIHTVHHLPLATLRRSWWGRRPLLMRMRAHHHHHHRLDRMAKVNFNVTFALADRLLGTYELPPAR